MRGQVYQKGFKAFVACACASASIVIAAPAAAQGSYSPYNETATSALARYVRALASDPRDFDSLIGAGRAALEIGDNQAAAGFFARADEVNPRSPLPQAGMGAVSVANGEPQGALPYFKRAQQLGEPIQDFACDRGLAYDLLGRQAEAQADYRLALSGADREEASRRLALSLAISGNRAEALQALAPLLVKNDPGALRARAFVLALTGDPAGATSAINTAMPGSWASVAPFLQRLSSLKSAEKAAAVNLGIFPDASGTAYAYAAPVPALPQGGASVATASTDRLPGVDQLLRAQGKPVPQVTPSWGSASAKSAQPGFSQQAPVQVAYAQVPRAIPAVQVQIQQQAASTPRQKKIWLQLASGSNSSALPAQFQRIKSKGGDLFDGIHPYVAQSADKARLVIGPFRGPSDAETFAEDLETIGVDSFKWSNSETDQIVPLSTQ
jgi:tetratricopeptide (TPR) repeat protein